MIFFYTHNDHSVEGTLEHSYFPTVRQHWTLAADYNCFSKSTPTEYHLASYMGHSFILSDDFSYLNIDQT